MRRLLAVLVAVGAVQAGATGYAVGPSRTYVSVCDLVSKVTLVGGDVVTVDAATYTDACKLTASGAVGNPIVLQGAAGGARPVFDAASLDLSGAGSVPRAIFQFTGGRRWLVQHLELKNAHNASDNGAAFRVTGGAGEIVIRDVSVHDCEDGFMSDGATASLTVENSDIFHNGAGDGFSHNFYLDGDSARLIGNHIHDSNGGQNVKLRTRYALLAYNRIENGGNYEIDLIQGSETASANAHAVLIGNVVIRPTTSGNNSQVILFASDNGTVTGRNGNLYAVNNTFVLRHASNRLLHAVSPASGSTITLINNLIASTVSGTGISADATTTALIQGHHNWISSRVTSVAGLTGTLSATEPGFVTGTERLAAGSPAINQGQAGVTYLDDTGASQSATPTQEFLSPAGTTPRFADATLDLGANEWVSSDGGTGVVDAGTALDGGGTDAGSTADAGTSPDAGGATDGGDTDEPPVTGCGCGTTGAPGFAVLALGLFALFRRRAAH